jgi:hypothetical protein
VVTIYQELEYLLDGFFDITMTPYEKMSEQKQMLMNWFVNALMK